MQSVSKNEEKALLLCARLDLDDAQALQLRDFLQDSSFHWPDLIYMAWKNAVLPLLYWNLNRFASALVPGETLQDLEKNFKMNAARNLFLVQELTRLMKLFQRDGFTVVPWRGPVFASWIYRNVALRYFSDLDILVRSQDVLPIKELLLREGYQTTLKFTPAEESALLKLHYTYDFDSADRRAHVEIHWDIVPHYFHCNVNIDRLLHRLVPVSLNGYQIMTLSPEDLILVQSVHNAKHRWERLSWICDFAAVLRAYPELNWSNLFAASTESGSNRMVLLGLHLAHELLDAPLPERVRSVIRADRKLATLAEQVRQSLFTMNGKENQILEESNFHPFHYRVREHFSDQLAYCALSLTSPSIEDWAWIKLPEPFFFLYSITRPARLAGKYFRKFLMKSRTR